MSRTDKSIETESRSVFSQAWQGMEVLRRNGGDCQRSGISHWGGENDPELAMMMIVPLCGYEKKNKHAILQFKWVNYMVYELHLNEATKREKKNSQQTKVQDQTASQGNSTKQIKKS